MLQYISQAIHVLIFQFLTEIKEAQCTLYVCKRRSWGHKNFVELYYKKEYSGYNIRKFPFWFKSIGLQLETSYTIKAPFIEKLHVIYFVTTGLNTVLFGALGLCGL